MQTYRLTREQLHSALMGAIGLYLEFRDVHEYEDSVAQHAGADEVMAGMDADKELAATDPTERLKLQLADNEDRLRGALEMLCNGLEWHIESHPLIMNEADNEALAEARSVLALVSAQQGAGR